MTRFAALVLLVLACPAAAAAQFVRVSVSSGGAQALGGPSGHASMSEDGRFVAFLSEASNLVAGDTNGVTDIFVHDRETGITTRVSVSSAGIQSNGRSLFPRISRNGQVVAFFSFATNLVPFDTNGVADVFVHDRQTGETTRVNVAPSGAQGTRGATDRVVSLSRTGRFVAFASLDALLADDTNRPGTPDVYVLDRLTGVLTLESRFQGAQLADGAAVPALSADGRHVAFRSEATRRRNVFVRDRQIGVTLLVSTRPDGEEGNGTAGETEPSVSADGRFVAFSSTSSDLVPDDRNLSQDVFIYDRLSRRNRRVSVDSTGNEAENGGFLFDLTPRAGHVAFVSTSANLGPGPGNRQDLFVHDLQSGVTKRVSGPTNGDEPDDGASGHPGALSDDGLQIAFLSNASNLVPGDTNGQADVFVGRTDVNVPTCATPVTPTTFSISGLGGLLEAAVTATLSKCTWRAVSQVDWLVIESGAAGRGSGAIGIRVAPLTGGGSRQGTIAVGSQIITVNQAADVPGAPHNLRAVITGNRATLIWEAPASGGVPTTYVIQAGSSPGASDLANFTTGSLATSFDTPAIGAGIYFVRIRAANALGFGGASNEITLTIGQCSQPPGPPIGLTVSATPAGSAFSITARWNPPITGGFPEAYVIQVGSESGASNLVNLDTGNIATSISGIAPPSTYYIRIRGRNACGVGAPSREVQLVLQ